MNNLLTCYSSNYLKSRWKQPTDSETLLNLILTGFSFHRDNGLINSQLLIYDESVKFMLNLMAEMLLHT